uniref:Uncharacterized protein n=1 Tax=Plectus sambesii TaxID=2011161 RepID=A0A914WHS1_9BILA
MGLSDRIRNWFSPPKPLSKDMKEGDHFQAYSSLRDLKKRQKTRQRRTRQRTASMPPELETWATKPRSASRIESDRILFVSPVRDFTERAVDCDGLDEKNAKKTAASRPPQPIPVSADDDAGLLNAWDRKFLRGGGGKKNKRKGDTRPASTSELAVLGVRFTAHSDSRRSPRPSQSIADLDRIGMDTIRSVPPSIEQYDSKLKFREAFAKGLWSIEPLKIGSGRSSKLPSSSPYQPHGVNGKQTKSRSIGDDRDIRLFNSYFKAAHHSKSPSSSESGVATDDDTNRESPKSVRFNKRAPLVIPEIANEYMVVIDDISSTRNRNDSNDFNDFNGNDDDDDDINDTAPIVSPLPSVISFEEEIERITSRMPNSSAPVIEQLGLNERRTFAADVLLDMNASTCEVLYRLNRPVTSAFDQNTPARIVLDSESSMSCLLLYPDGRFHSFGQVARQFYCDLEPPEAQTFMFFDKLSASLLVGNDLTIDSQMRARNGASHRTIDVLTECFRHFKLRSTRKLSDLNSCNPIDSQSVRWTIVLTSTASPAAMQLVREAAEKACLISSRVSDQLCLLSASDAMAIGCVEQANDLKLPRLSVDDAFVVVNAGIDCTEISAYKVKRDGCSLEQLIVPKNERYGVCTFEAEFEKLLMDVFSKDFIKDLKRKYPGAWLELMTAFETKRSAGQFLSESALQPLTVPVPLIFAEMLKKKRGIKPQAAVKKYNNPDVSWGEQGMLKLQPNLLRSIQETAIGTVTNAVGQAVSEIAQPAYLFLDGPWSRSALLADQIKRTFSSTVKVSVVQSLSSLVQQAAALRDRPFLIHPRLSPLTLGVSVLNPFDPALHPPSKRMSKHGNQWCNDIFDRLITRGCAVQKAVRRYCPASQSQKEMAITVYCCETPSPQFTTDENVRKCGSVRLDLTALQSTTELREVEVTLDFTRADVTIAAKDISSGQMLIAHLDFLRHSR